MINPPGAVFSGGEIPSTDRLGGEWVGARVPRGGHIIFSGCPSSPPAQPPRSTMFLSHCTQCLCGPSGRGFTDSSCKELVSIFSRQRQKFREVTGSLSLQRVMKGNGQSQVPERTVSATSILFHLPTGDPVPMTFRNKSILPPSPLP